MKTYKLKKWYPSLNDTWTEGMEVGQGDRKGRYADFSPCASSFVDKRLSYSEVTDNEDFWEEMVKKEYEILSFKEKVSKYNIITKDIDGFGIMRTEKGLLQSNMWDIHSIKRLSDGEVFTVGDKIIRNGWDSGKTILSITLNDETRLLIFHGTSEVSYIEQISHIKKPLFTTEDNVDLYKGDKYFQIGYKFENTECEAYDESNFDDSLTIFSTKEKAEKYIVMNKPCLSINDIKKVWGGPFGRRGPVGQVFQSDLKTFVKNKKDGNT